MSRHGRTRIRNRSKLNRRSMTCCSMPLMTVGPAPCRHRRAGQSGYRRFGQARSRRLPKPETSSGCANVEHGRQPRLVADDDATKPGEWRRRGGAAVPAAGHAIICEASAAGLAAVLCSPPAPVARPEAGTAAHRRRPGRHPAAPFKQQRRPEAPTEEAQPDVGAARRGAAPLQAAARGPRPLGKARW